jgi:Tol biopolymer transport system component
MKNYSQLLQKSAKHSKEIIRSILTRALTHFKSLSFKFLVVFIAFAGLISCQETVRYTTETLKEPTLFAKGIIATVAHNEFNLDFSPDGKTVYFTRRKEGEPQKIFVSHFKNMTWSMPEIASFSTARDEMPTITPDGKLYFSSTRPIPNRKSEGNFDMNIWVTTLENDTWSTPKPVDSIINKVQIQGEKWPSSNESSLYTQDGKTFYYATKMRGSKGIGIYTTNYENGTFSIPARINGLFDDEAYWTSSPVLSPDGNYLLFNAYDTAMGFGGEDIYVSKKTANGWSKAKVLPKTINSKGEEASPRFSRDGHYFFFVKSVATNTDEDGIWSIYYMETQYLQLDSLFSDR